MTQEEKQLLLKDLCARLPYRVKIGLIGEDKKLFGYPAVLDIEDYKNSNPLIIINSNWLPFLRPMSSMTEEEIKTYHSYCECNDGDFTGEILYFDTIESFDYLNSIHIDYRGLIPMGLALYAPEGMYNTSQKWTPLRSGLKENEDGQIVGGLKL